MGIKPIAQTESKLAPSLGKVRSEMVLSRCVSFNVFPMLSRMLQHETTHLHPLERQEGDTSYSTEIRHLQEEQSCQLKGFGGPWWLLGRMGRVCLR